MRTKLILPLFFGLLGLSLTSQACGKRCKNEDPRARIVNNGTASASVQIKTSGGNTENINNVMPGTFSEYRHYAPGFVIFTTTIDRQTYVDTVSMTTCFEYDIVIGPDNRILSVPTDRNER